jgi:hypothetical protein
MAIIEIIAIGHEKKLYSIVKVETNASGDVYVIPKIWKMHLSRHSSGVRHFKILDNDGKEIETTYPSRPPIGIFQGVESLHTGSFGINSLQHLWKEPKFKKADGVFVIDMRSYEYESARFNLGIYILTESGIQDFYKIWSHASKKQTYVYSDSIPMIGIIAADVNVRTKIKKLFPHRAEKQR